MGNAVSTRHKTIVYPERLVQRVNELYHDLVATDYDADFDWMFKLEKENWKKVAYRFWNFKKPMTVADIGTGTGFVPISTAEYLRKQDTFICLDLSQAILEVAKQNIRGQNFSCNFKFLEIESQVPLSLPLKKASVDIVTINAVLHHIQNIQRFLDEVNRILKPDGLVCIGHEPNSYFYESKTLWWNYVLINSVLSPEITIAEISRKMHLYRIAQRIYYFLRPQKRKKRAQIVSRERKEVEIADSINKSLCKEGFIEKPLSIEEMGHIVDIRSREGLNPYSLLPKYRLLHLETYCHLFWISMKRKNFLIKKYDCLLRRIYPDKGAKFFEILQKT